MHDRMIIDNHVRHLIRPSENPNHPCYGPARRLWLMLEQLMSDFPGKLEGLEKRLKALHLSQGREPLIWDEHLFQLIAAGLSESAAQRIILIQMLNAREYLA